MYVFSSWKIAYCEENLILLIKRLIQIVNGLTVTVMMYLFSKNNI